ncbi:MAG TPA: class I SAM-dependent methyltransferase, partial [Bryobacteraceae bacterium]|nr:class I SAM-dependent methyltransferase [Bryobacteraceae bacterium]
MSGSPNGASAYHRLRAALPRPIARYVMHFEAAIEDALAEFARSLPEGARVLDAGAGEGAYRKYFTKHRYCGIDLAVGDVAWDYSKLDVIGNLEAIPLRTAAFDACLNIVTLEHVEQPQRVVCEMARTLKPGGRILLVAPLEWEEHQQPHDYFRYTRFALKMLLEQAGFVEIEIQPVGGFFRLLSRRLF